MRSRAELCLSIGGVVGQLTLHHTPPALLARLRKQYAAFALPCSPRIHRAFNLTLTFTEGARQPANRQPVVRTTSDEIDIWRSDFSVALTADATAAPWRGVGECQATAAAFEALLQILWSALLPVQGGGLFRACAFRRGRRAFVVAARRGAGKTTLARKVPDPDDLLGDALVAIHRGPGGEWRASGTPFHGGLGRTAASLESVPLAALSFLDQQASLTVARITRAQAVLQALECLISFQSDTATVQRNVSLVLGICTELPALRLGSAPGTPFEDVAQALEKAAPPSPAAPPPASARERISSLRARLARHGRYAVTSQGGSMGPFIDSGDCLFIEPVNASEVVPGDIIVYWQPGPRPGDDLLISHRLVARADDGQVTMVVAKGDANPHVEAFASGQQAEVIGRVQAVARRGQAREVPSRLGGLALLGLSMMLSPLRKARLRS